MCSTHGRCITRALKHGVAVPTWCWPWQLGWRRYTHAQAQHTPPLAMRASFSRNPLVPTQQPACARAWRGHAFNQHTRACRRSGLLSIFAAHVHTKHTKKDRRARVSPFSSLSLSLSLSLCVCVYGCACACACARILYPFFEEPTCVHPPPHTPPHRHTHTCTHAYAPFIEHRLALAHHVTPRDLVCHLHVHACLQRVVFFQDTRRDGRLLATCSVPVPPRLHHTTKYTTKYSQFHVLVHVHVHVCLSMCVCMGRCTWRGDGRSLACQRGGIGFTHTPCVGPLYTTCK